MPCPPCGQHPPGFTRESNTACLPPTGASTRPPTRPPTHQPSTCLAPTWHTAAPSGHAAASGCTCCRWSCLHACVCTQAHAGMRRAGRRSASWGSAWGRVHSEQQRAGRLAGNAAPTTLQADGSAPNDGIALPLGAASASAAHRGVHGDHSCRHAASPHSQSIM